MGIKAFFAAKTSTAASTLRTYPKIQEEFAL
jgi:hypothetical protein